MKRLDLTRWKGAVYMAWWCWNRLLMKTLVLSVDEKVKYIWVVLCLCRPSHWDWQCCHQDDHRHMGRTSHTPWGCLLGRPGIQGPWPHHGACCSWVSPVLPATRSRPEPVRGAAGPVPVQGAEPRYVGEGLPGSRGCRGGWWCVPRGQSGQFSSFGDSCLLCHCCCLKSCGTCTLVTFGGKHFFFNMCSY